MRKIDFSSYVHGPRINAVNGVLLTIRMLRVAPKDLSPDELAALQQMRNDAAAVQEVVAARHRNRRVDLRPVDRRFDGSWAGLVARVQAWIRLIGHANGERAQELLDKLFPNGLSFLTWDYDSQWGHSRMLLKRIYDEDLYDDLVELASEPFVTAVEEAHAELGAALGLDEEAEAEVEAEPSNPQLREMVVALSESIGDYGRVLAGSVKRSNPDSVARFLAAVAPLDRFRAQSRRGGGAAGDEEELDEGEAIDDSDEPIDFDSPLPELPDEG